MSGFRLFVYEEVDSTMDVARNKAGFRTETEEGLAGLMEDFLVIAARQREGRGRRGGTWHSPAGNFYGTFCLTPALPQSYLPMCSFAAALALYDALCELVALKPLQGSQSKSARFSEQLRVKWPNDLLLSTAKVSGLLLENLGKGRVLIGTGVNLRLAPKLDDKAYESGDLSRWTQAEPLDLVPLLSDRLRFWIDALKEHGFAPLRQTWLNRAYGIGQEIQVRLPQASIEGQFVGLDEQGRIEVVPSQSFFRSQLCQRFQVDPDGLLRFSAGQVFWSS